MFYVYVSRSGKRVELQFPIGKAPNETKHDNDVYFRDTMAEIASQQFILKGGGWPSQDTRRKQQMTRNNVEAGNRTQKTWGKPKKCLPNHKGKLTDSWEDVKKLVKKEG